MASPLTKVCYNAPKSSVDIFYIIHRVLSLVFFPFADIDLLRKGKNNQLKLCEMTDAAWKKGPLVSS